MTEVYEAIKNDIKQTISNLMKHKLIINPSFSDKSCKIDRISSRLNGSKIDKSKSYVENFLKFYNENEYLFLFLDNSFIQVNYEFVYHKELDKQVVSKANLNFYPNPGLYEEGILEMMKEDKLSADEQIAFWDSLKMDLEKDFTYHSNYMRLDYSHSDSDFTELTHPRCHIHFGLNNNFRIATNKLPLLSDFIDLVLFTSYTENWEQLHRDEISDKRIYSQNRKTKLTNYIQLTEFEEVLTQSESDGYLLKLI